jgi:Flp pilus assembly protein TadB
MQAPRSGHLRRTKEFLMGLVIGLLILWVIVVIVGFIVKSLFWLAIVGIVLFVATAGFGALRRRSGSVH